MVIDGAVSLAVAAATGAEDADAGAGGAVTDDVSAAATAEDTSVEGDTADADADEAGAWLLISSASVADMVESPKKISVLT